MEGRNSLKRDDIVTGTTGISNIAPSLASDNIEIRQAPFYTLVPAERENNLNTIPARP
jgi:hypothetical protein